MTFEVWQAADGSWVIERQLGVTSKVVASFASREDAERERERLERLENRLMAGGFA